MGPPLRNEKVRSQRWIKFAPADPSDAPAKIVFDGQYFHSEWNSVRPSVLHFLAWLQRQRGGHELTWALERFPLGKCRKIARSSKTTSPRPRGLVRFPLSASGKCLASRRPSIINPRNPHRTPACSLRDRRTDDMAVQRWSPFSRWLRSPGLKCALTLSASKDSRASEEKDEVIIRRWWSLNHSSGQDILAAGLSGLPFSLLLGFNLPKSRLSRTPMVDWIIRSFHFLGYRGCQALLCVLSSSMEITCSKIETL